MSLGVFLGPQILEVCLIDLLLNFYLILISLSSHTLLSSIMHIFTVLAGISSLGSWFTPPDTSLPPADDADPVQLVLLGGQSECTGSGLAADLIADDTGRYQDLVGIQDGVWFAGVDDASDEVFIAPYEAGIGTDAIFRNNPLPIHKYIANSLNSVG